MVTAAQERQEIRRHYPYLSEQGIDGAMRPTDFFVEFCDSDLYAHELARVHGEESVVDPANITKRQDARTLAAARRIARRVLREQPLSCPEIYRRSDIWREEDIYRGYRIPLWHVEDYEYVEGVEA